MSRRPEVAWSDRFGLLIQWPEKDPYWFYGPVFRSAGITAMHGPNLPDDAIILKPSTTDFNAVENLLDAAWGLIANAGGTGGHWENETEDWQQAAVRWREQYHKWIHTHVLNGKENAL